MEHSILVQQPSLSSPDAVSPSDAVVPAIVPTAEQLPSADRALVLRMLNEALSLEVMCAQRCQSQAILARGLDAPEVADDLERHATDAHNHAQRLLQRIAQLDGGSLASTEHLAHVSQSEYVEGVTLIDMLNENLATERMAVAGYREMVDYLGEKDPVTRQLLEDIMAMEAAQVHELARQLDQR
ncbi:ferritin-like domain-containing protein [Bordetella muralis]|uniref:ferritin-like domain-containing protein n=1 Tax=Bordetella muralis TaxID=1649130 RepID=UPI0039EEB6A1